MPRNKTTRPISGPALKKYLRDLIEADTSLESGASQRLADTMAREIAEARVRLPVPVRRKPSGSEAQPQGPVTPAPATGPRADVAGETVAPKAAVPAAAPTNPDAPPGAPDTSTPAFDPYAFSVVALLTRKGREATLARLAELTDAQDLRRLAEAQHIAVPKEARTLDEIRAAVLAGAERRIADRRAAAS